MARPVCARLGAHLHGAATEAGINVAKGGTYTSGPQACRAAARWTQTPVFRGGAVGLRLCRPLG